MTIASRRTRRVRDWTIHTTRRKWYPKSGRNAGGLKRKKMDLKTVGRCSNQLKRVGRDQLERLLPRNHFFLSPPRMRPLTEDESKLVFTKLANYIVCLWLFLSVLL